MTTQDTRELWKQAVGLQKKRDAAHGFRVPTVVPVDDPTAPDPSLARLDDAGHVTRLAERRRNRVLVGKALALAIDEAQDKLSEQTKREIVEGTMKHLENG